MNDLDNLMATLTATEDAINASLTQDEKRWGKVRRIVMSAKRTDSLRANAPATSPSPWASIAVDSSPMCDDSFAVLVNGAGAPIGIFSFETGTTRWFDEAAMNRAIAPSFKFAVRDRDEFPFTSQFSKYGLAGFRRLAR